MSEELKAKITGIIEQVGEGGLLDNLTSEQIADRILAMPEIQNLRARLRDTNEALAIALEPWSGAGRINGDRLVAENREMLA